MEWVAESLVADYDLAGYSFAVLEPYALFAEFGVFAFAAFRALDQLDMVGLVMQCLVGKRTVDIRRFVAIVASGPC